MMALPGFLGLPTDWDFIEGACGIDLHAFNASNLEEWVDLFAESVGSGTILMGYSFGGRLALHVLLKYPKLFEAAIIISAHPGLLTEQEKQTRLQLDEEWACRFEQENWKTLMKSWNDRPIFLPEGHHFVREEGDYDRKKLAAMLRWGSLGNQRDLRGEIAALDIPVLWITGEKDWKYTELAQEVRLLNVNSKHVTMLGAGHRCPWEQPSKFKQLIQEFKNNH